MKQVQWVILTVGLSYCTTPTTPSDNPQQLATEQSKSTDKSQNTLASLILMDYMKIKDALVASDNEKVSLLAKNFLNDLKNEMNPSSEVLSEAVSSLSNALDLDTQRQAFKSVTEVLTQWVKASNTQETLFVQFCPMAFKSQGANWLSRSEEIKNPYFGAMMLNCGRIDEKIN
ncbi:DUF3347 domain-containing protein [Cyclobacteriaceae bacterium]|nr:DUF3347 domain-containing protein [bacterium]MDC1517203.1 DUF3347 domain-containing protein [Cyclobacteriaceae bacterium]